MNENFEYRVVSDRYSDRDLEEIVNDLIAQGWRPQGGVSVIVERGATDKQIKFQAMVRYYDCISV